MKEGAKNQEGVPEMIFSWQAYRFENIERHPWWHIIVFLILLGLLAYGLFTNNFFLGIIVILLGLLIYLFEKRDPVLFDFGITKEGIFAQDHIYPFKTTENFWIFYEPVPNGRKELSLKTDRKIFPYVSIPLGDNDPNKIREVLIKYIPEEEHEESFVDILERHM